MNAIVLHMMLSLDGYFEGPDGSLAWHHVDEELHQEFNDLLRGTGVFVSGRVNYQLMDSYWPLADQQPDASPAEVDFAGIWRRVPKVVYSTTLDEVGDNATLYPSVDPDVVRTLRDQADGDLVVGGGILGRCFLALDLIDELRLFINPTIVGGGRRLFEDGMAPTEWQLADTRVFGNGVVLLHYRRP